jgi:hypothetical protein
MIGKNLQELASAIAEASFIAIILVLLLPGHMTGQVLSHPLNPSGDDAFSLQRPLQSFPDTVHVLAAMVQFQQDDDPLTTGDGRFDLSAPRDSVLDATPHDRQYFEDHLTFLQNYYRKSSKGKVVVLVTLVDLQYTLPDAMARYSPPKDGSFEEVADLAVDTWRMVDSSGLVGDFSLYEAFVVFHAGVGRDIDLVAAIGFDPTPKDIPSLYLGLNAFREVYGDDFQGIPVQGGSFLITNSAITPTTESRTLPGAVGDVLLELTINGLLCASLGNHLGLPDLFDTETGRSGIGRFGLMDGQAIFSFSGVFPPEPSAWEKQWLGWLDPIDLPVGSTDIVLPAASLADSVYRVTISKGEYFLLENRHRDPLRDGQTVWSRFNGALIQQVFERDTAGFNAFDITALAGVITDVQDMDWSLPGGVDQDGEFFDGGSLIWHIDEAVLSQTISTNSVNANPDRRGVDLEEADGSQDIGQEYGFLSPGSGSEDGTALDFWFQGNSSPVNENTFSTGTFPDSRSSLNANSLVTIKDFSSRSPRMTAQVIRGSSEVSPLPRFPRSLGEVLPPRALTIGPVQSGASSAVFVSTTGRPIPFSGTIDEASPIPGGKIFAWDVQGLPALPGGFTSGWMGTSAPDASFLSGSALADLDGDGVTESVTAERPVTTVPGKLRSLRLQDLSPADSLADLFFETSAGGPIGGNVVVADSLIAFAQEGPRVYFAGFDGSIVDSMDFSSDAASAVTGISRFEGQNSFLVTASSGELVITSRSFGGGTTEPDRRMDFPAAITAPAATAFMGEEGSGQVQICFATSNGQVHLLREDFSAAPGFPVATRDTVTEPPALADIDGDGRRDVVVLAGSFIHAWNHTGAVLDGYPVRVNAELPLGSAPVVGDVDGDGGVEILAVSRDGLVVAHGRDGTMARGFPLAAGRGRQSAAVFTRSDSIFVAVSSSDDGSVSAWFTGTAAGGTVASSYPWPQYQRDARHSGFDASPLQGVPISNEFFPTSRAYNWPNPVYEGRTTIRYFVSDDASVAIRIFDLAGDLVTEFSGPGVGGVDNEVEWNVRDVQSGVYFARIEATGSGKSGVAVVKVAVVK